MANVITENWMNDFQDVARFYADHLLERKQQYTSADPNVKRLKLINRAERIKHHTFSRELKRVAKHHHDLAHMLKDVLEAHHDFLMEEKEFLEGKTSQEDIDKIVRRLNMVQHVIPRLRGKLHEHRAQNEKLVRKLDNWVMSNVVYPAVFVEIFVDLLPIVQMFSRGTKYSHADLLSWSELTLVAVICVATGIVNDAMAGIQYMRGKQVTFPKGLFRWGAGKMVSIARKA